MLCSSSDAFLVLTFILVLICYHLIGLVLERILEICCFFSYLVHLEVVGNSSGAIFRGKICTVSLN